MDAIAIHEAVNWFTLESELEIMAGASIGMVR